MLNFKPLNEDEIQTLNLAPEGEYPFKVKFAEPKVSQAGSPMIKLIVTILVNGREHNVFDYLLSIESMLFKLRHFCYATGLEHAYEAGTLRPEDCINRVGTCRVGVKEDKTGKYLPSNVILDYIKAETVPAKTLLKEALNDDIPF